MEERLARLEQRLSRLETLVGAKLSQEQARKYIGVSRNTIIKYRDLGLLHPRREGKRLYYNVEELNKFCCSFS